jgi:hypothetical protein
VLLPDRLTVYLSAPIALAEQMRRFAAELPEAVAELVDLLTDSWRRRPVPGAPAPITHETRSSAPVAVA